MTVREFLSSTPLSFAEIASKVGAHITRVYAWRDGKSFPSGRHFAGLYRLSGKRIDLDEQR